MSEGCGMGCGGVKAIFLQGCVRISMVGLKGMRSGEKACLRWPSIRSLLEWVGLQVVLE